MSKYRGPSSLVEQAGARIELEFGAICWVAPDDGDTGANPG